MTESRWRRMSNGGWVMEGWVTEDEWWWIVMENGWRKMEMGGGRGFKCYLAIFFLRGAAILNRDELWYINFHWEQSCRPHHFLWVKLIPTFMPVGRWVRTLKAKMSFNHFGHGNLAAYFENPQKNLESYSAPHESHMYQSLTKSETALHFTSTPPHKKKREKKR